MLLRQSSSLASRAASTALPRAAAAAAAFSTSSSSAAAAAGASSSGSKKPPSLITLADLSLAQLQSLTDTAYAFKQAVRAVSPGLPSGSRKVHPSSSFPLPPSAELAAHASSRETGLPLSLAEKTVALLFTKRSTRTRVASETSVASLGGHAMFLGPSDIQLGVNESLHDTAKIVSSMTDGIMARVGAHEEIETLVEHSSVPVVNALSSRYHPTQILADLLTLVEHYPSEGSGSIQASAKQGSSLVELANRHRLRVAWVGDSNNILNELIVTLPRLGIDLSIATPPPKASGLYARDEIVWATAQAGLRASAAEAKELGFERQGELFWTHDPAKAVEGADVLVTDTWVSMGDEGSKAERLRDFKGYQITEQLARAGGAKPDWKFMHCLPRKQEEVDDEVFYGPRSLVFPEGENRKWTIMAVFDRIFGRWEL